MKFDKHFPSEHLKPYIRYFAVSENSVQGEYKVFPSTGLVIGFQYRGRLAVLSGGMEQGLHSAGITGIADGCKVFRNSENIGTLLVYFTEMGFAHFASQPVNELFNLSVALEDVFEKQKVTDLEEKLSHAESDSKRIMLAEQFFTAELREIHTDKLVVEAVRLIYESKGSVRIREINEKLCISQSPFEKRFRKVVGTTPKKFATIVRFNTVLDSLNQAKTLTEICYENNFFDQAHFIHEFRKFTGGSPDHFRRSDNLKKD